MKRESILAFIDIETSGLDVDKHEILELGAIVTDWKMRELGRFVYKLLPEHIETAEPEALKINGYDPDTWSREAVSMQRALLRLNGLIPHGKRAIPIGHNVRKFDLPFIRKAYKKERISDLLSWWIVDTVDLSVAYAIARGDPLPNVRLTTMSKMLDLHHSKAHSAMSDIKANMELFMELVGLMRMGYLECQEPLVAEG